VPELGCHKSDVKQGHTIDDGAKIFGFETEIEIKNLVQTILISR